MTDAEISRRLALAIGWDSLCIEVYGDTVTVWPWSTSGGKWKKFDYRAPAVIWPIAERFNAFPTFLLGSWTACIGTDFETEIDADTAAKAVAIAVIKAHEGVKE